MTARASFTEKQLCRIMRAAKKEACPVELHPDGKVVVDPRRPLSIVPVQAQSEEDEWDKV